MERVLQSSVLSKGKLWAQPTALESNVVPGCHGHENPWIKSQAKKGSEAYVNIDICSS